jgi:hypothetical protein
MVGLLFENVKMFVKPQVQKSLMLAGKSEYGELP